MGPTGFITIKVIMVGQFSLFREKYVLENGRVRMGKLVKSKSFQSLFLSLLLIICLSTIPYKTALTFQLENTGKVLIYIPLGENPEFKVKYTHSIHLSDVVESYKITTNYEIKQVELEFSDFSIGMPENAADGEIFEQKNGKYYIKNMNRIFPYFDLRTGKVRANHTVIFKNKNYPLNEYIEPGTWVRIKVNKINLYQQWKGVNIIGGEI